MYLLEPKGDEGVEGSWVSFTVKSSLGVAKKLVIKYWSPDDEQHFERNINVWEAFPSPSSMKLELNMQRRSSFQLLFFLLLKDIFF
jgi:hypothetical protein